MKLVLLVYELIPKDWKRKFFFLMLVYVVLGVLEMLGVASVLPFIALLSDPQVLEKGFVAGIVGSVTSVKLSSVPVYWIGAFVLTLFLATNMLALLSTWLSVRFSNRLAVRLATDVSTRYFAQGYDFLRSKSPSVLTNYTVREVEKIVSGGVLQLCLVVSRSFQVGLIFLLLATVSPIFSLAFSLVSLFLYVLFFWFLRGRLATAGQDLIRSSGNAANSANELYSGAKEIAVRGNLDFLLSDVRNWLLRRGKADEVARVFPIIPKYAIELAAFSAILSVPIYRSCIGEEYRSILPLMALFAYAGYRLLPALQQVFSAFSTLKFVGPTIEYFSVFLKEEAIKTEQRLPALSTFSRISAREISYTYPGAENPALSMLSFEIKFGEKVAIVGLSGVGKSTVIDILLGLVAPSSGELLVDGRDYSQDGLVWEKGSLGYAPQTPMMLNKTVAENIAFGVANVARCAEVAKTACIDDVIEAQQESYLTHLGNDGITLSGGECQRISVARALYHSPVVAVFDEPSSALDPLGSRRLIANLCDHALGVTTIIVTHDWDVLDLFDRIIVLGNGSTICEGSYSDVIQCVNGLRECEGK
ncbi:MAG: Lipid A export ATP-binding/permease protein MsbA [Betaproteobacteria bacterium ADurb.Bin341]|nr:MAG: Lipid A export ATP-binding/permease protein MsbA [Betaproteobacteria bacterium ADurb.Bin341]